MALINTSKIENDDMSIIMTTAERLPDDVLASELSECISDYPVFDGSNIVEKED